MSWSPDSRKIRLAKYIAYTVYEMHLISYLENLEKWLESSLAVTPSDELVSDESIVGNIMEAQTTQHLDKDKIFLQMKKHFSDTLAQLSCIITKFF